MSEDVWSARDTNPDEIEAALRDMLRERHAANGALAPARVLNLVVVVDREWKGEIANRLERVGSSSASRTVLCAVEPGRTKLDAVVVMSYEEPNSRSMEIIREMVEIDMGPGHLRGLETIVDPVVVSDLPTLVWSPHGHDEALRALAEMTDAMLIDSDDLSDPPAALDRAAELLEHSYVVDLAWLRTTPWRERLAASFDSPNRRAALRRLSGMAIRHQASSSASAILLAGWLSSRLDWEPGLLQTVGRDLSGIANCDGASVKVELQPAPQDVPGLAGVTVTWDEHALSLDRAAGGLHARLTGPGEDGAEWQMLGGSRGEGGILGEGVRQAMLRDPTYGPALAAARAFCG